MLVVEDLDAAAAAMVVEQSAIEALRRRDRGRNRDEDADEAVLANERA